MEILPGVHQIALNYHERTLNLYLILAGDQSLLMDTGDASIPARDIFTYFAGIGFDPARLTYVMLTHPDIDHTGGIYAVKRAAPQAKFFCGAADRTQVETPEGLADIRARAHYHWHGLGPDDAARAAFIERAGGAGAHIIMDRTFDAGEPLSLGGKELRVLHLPGHSHGHLGVHLPRENTAIIGDAVQGTCNPFLNGRAAFAPTYMDVDAYLGTIDQLAAMRLDRIYSGHWADCASRSAVEDFLSQSRTYAMRAELVILETLMAAGTSGMTLHDVCLTAKPRLGNWPAERDLDTRSMACGHLQRLTTWGLVHVTDDRPTRYFYEAQWRGVK